MLWSIVVFALLLLGAAVCLAEDLTVLKAQPGQAQPSQMMETYLRDRARSALARRQAEYETLKTPEQIRSYQHRMREFFLQQLGGLPERTPLHAQVVGTLSLDGYRVQKITYSSQPGLLVTATLYLPESAPPYPVVLIPCGHDKNGKAAQAYQRAAMLLTRHGIAAFCYDPIGQGERSQLLDADGKARHVEVRGGVDVRHLRRLAPKQRAPRSQASFGNPLHDVHHADWVQPAHPQVVQEKQRLGAAADHVVHIHRHAIDARLGQRRNHA
jgi:hypothetical protein